MGPQQNNDLEDERNRNEPKSKMEYSDSDVEGTLKTNNDLVDERNGSEYTNNAECSESEKEREIDDEKDEQETNENDCDEKDDSKEEKSKGVDWRERGVYKYRNRWLLSNKKIIGSYCTL